MFRKAIPVIVFLVVASVIVVILTMALGSGSDGTMNTAYSATSTVVEERIDTPFGSVSASAVISGSSTPSGKIFTMSDVAVHNNAQSCWTTINEGVYDLTTWIDKHPGGKGAILGICGKDGTSAFLSRHDGQSGPERALASFKIGVLAGGTTK